MRDGTRLRTLAIALLLVGCGGSSVDRELERGGGEAVEDPAADGAGDAAGGDAARTAGDAGTAGRTPGEGVTGAEGTGDTTSEDPQLEVGDDAARYGETTIRVGDRVQLARRVGLLPAPGDHAGKRVEAAAGKTGRVTGIGADGLVEVTWDAQAWTVHGGYAWDGAEDIDPEAVGKPKSRSAGTLDLPEFVTSVHVAYLALDGG